MRLDANFEILIDLLSAAACLSDSALVSFNEVTRRRAPLVLGPVTVLGPANHLVM